MVMSCKSIPEVEGYLLQWTAIPQAPGTFDVLKPYFGGGTGILIVYYAHDSIGHLLNAGSEIGELDWKMIFCIFNKLPSETCQDYSCIGQS